MWFSFILDILFPVRCIGCGKIGTYFCISCQRSIQIIPSNDCICPICEKPAIGGATHPRCRGRFTLDGVISVFRYRSVIKNALKMVKYRYVSDLVLECIRLIPPTSYNIVEQQIDRDSVVCIPIPLHISRIRLRGFNQAELFGIHIADSLHIPMRKDLLIRVKATVPQVEMKNRNDRLKNMEHVFSVHLKESRSIPQCVLLIDDVFTTGATMRSAASVLKRVGVKSVWAFTMAR